MRRIGKGIGVNKTLLTSIYPGWYPYTYIYPDFPLMTKDPARTETRLVTATGGDALSGVLLFLLSHQQQLNNLSLS